MTLREQIIGLHKKYHSEDFHNYRGGLVTAMLNDLALHFFDNVVGEKTTMNFVLIEEMMAVKHARGLMLVGEFDGELPAYKWSEV